MLTETIIKKLKDDKEYYGGIGKNYLSNSDIGALLSNPKEYGKDDIASHAEVKLKLTQSLVSPAPQSV